MMRTTLVLLLTLATVFFSNVMAQNKKVKGYYVSLDGDTIKGTFPEYRLWQKNPSRVKFRTNNRENDLIITPRNVRSFSVEGQHRYYAYHGSQHVNKEDRTETRIDVFLKLVYQAGKVRLFEFKNSNISNYYLQVQGSPLTELVYTQTISNDEYLVNDSFKKQISAEFEKEITGRELANDLASLEYTEQSLIDFFKKLLGPSEIKTKKLYKPEFYLAAGISVNRLDASIGPDWDRRKGDFDPTITPVISAGVQLYDQKTAGRLFYAFSLSTYSFKNETQYTVQNSGTTTIKYNGRTISPCFHLGYNLMHTKTIQFYLQAGGGIMFFTNAEKSEYFVSNTSVPVTHLEKTKFTSTGNLNLNLQAGFAVAGRFSVWGSYLVPMSMYSGETEVAQHMPLQLGVRYLFKRK